MRKPLFSFTMTLMIAALALTGCSRNPVSPQTTLPSDPGTTSMAGMPVDDAPLPIQGEGGASGSLSLAAHEAGVLKVGRWSLTIHKNSHELAAMISLTVRDPNSMEVEIEVTPASANNFQVPIELVADCSDLPSLVLEETGIFWWNESWELATDLTTQSGQSLLKAKSTVLSNAMISSRNVLVTARGRK